jgi:hypothetical protein
MKRLIWVATFLFTGSICVAAQNVQDRHMLQGLSSLTVFFVLRRLRSELPLLFPL